MVVTISEQDGLAIAQAISEGLLKAYANDLVTVNLTIGDDLRWPAYEPSWDDVLIVLFGSQDFPDSGIRFILEYKKARSESNVLPIALNEMNTVPPKPIEGIKAITYNGRIQHLSNLVILRVGALLGLRLRRRESTIFVSYRSTDGGEIALQLHDYLKNNGFQPWLDATSHNN